MWVKSMCSFSAIVRALIKNGASFHDATQLANQIVLNGFAATVAAHGGTSGNSQAQDLQKLQKAQEKLDSGESVTITDANGNSMTFQPGQVIALNGGGGVMGLYFAPNSLAAADVGSGGGKPVFNAGDVAGVLNGTPAGQALLGRLKGEFVVKTGDVYLTMTKDGKVVAARDAAGNLVPATGLVGGYVKGTTAPGVIVINNLTTSTGTFKGTSAQFYAYVLVQEVNEYDIWKAGTPGNDKAVEVINRVNAENQARAMGLPEAQAGYRTATGAPDVDAIRRDVASNPAYNGPTHGGSYIIRNGAVVTWP